MNEEKINVIGISGGIASGKSTIAKMLGSLGAAVIDADVICHQLIDCKEIKPAIVEKWGAHILTKQGKISRRNLGKIVFSDKKELQTLNDIIHPEVIRLIKSQTARLINRDKTVVLDAALLVESNLAKLCDIILYVDTKEQVCVKRAQKNRKWPSDEKAKRERYQSPMKEKKAIATIIINNNSTKKNTFSQVKDFWVQFLIKQEKHGG